MNIISGLIVGLITMVMSNVMPQVKGNFTFGLRTPWILKNEKVWVLSNRFTSRLMFAVGFMILLSVLVISKYIAIISVSRLVGTALVGTIHSYIVYKQIVK